VSIPITERSQKLDTKEWI